MTARRYAVTGETWMDLSTVPDLPDEEVKRLYRDAEEFDARVLYYTELRVRGLSIPTPEEVDDDGE